MSYEILDMFRLNVPSRLMDIEFSLLNMVSKLELLDISLFGPPNGITLLSELMLMAHCSTRFSSFTGTCSLDTSILGHNVTPGCFTWNSCSTISCFTVNCFLAAWYVSAASIFSCLIDLAAGALGFRVGCSSLVIVGKESSYEGSGSSIDLPERHVLDHISRWYYL